MNIWRQTKKGNRMKTTQEKIEVMQAYANGEQIQFKVYGGVKWFDANPPKWNWTDCDYRIKPEKKYRPYKSTEEMVEDFDARFGTNRPANTMPFIWVKGRFTKAAHLIHVFGDTYVYIGNNVLMISDLFTRYTYLDGSPCGKLVSEKTEGE